MKYYKIREKISFGLNFIELKFKLSRQFVKYVMLGVSGVAVDLSIYVVFVNFFHTDPAITNFFSSSLATIYTFILNVLFNFRTKDNLILRGIAFYSVGLVGIAVTTGMIWLFIDHLNWGKNLVKFLSLFVVLAVQYNLNKRISFRKKA